MADISVILPTRNRAALLGRVLGLLCEQTLAPDAFEICVVDNASTDATPKVMELVHTHYPHHRISYVREERLGVSFARNTGIANTTGAWVVFADDDAFPPADWLERLVKKTQSMAAEDPKLAKVGGEVAPIWAAPRPDWLTDEMLPLLTAVSGFGDKPRYVDEGLLENNCCYRREALVAAGGFPTTLDRKGGNLLSGGHAVDLVMIMAGWKLFYDPSICVQHYIHADRLTPAWFRRRYFWQGVSDFAVYDYLKGKGIQPAGGIAVDMPLGRDYWTFINDSNEVPTLDGLKRLRGLGFILAKIGFIPLS
jgi:glycosyltransferase involved in cell wall biosynthesis